MLFICCNKNLRSSPFNDTPNKNFILPPIQRYHLYNQFVRLKYPPWFCSGFDIFCLNQGFPKGFPVPGDTSLFWRSPLTPLKNWDARLPGLQLTQIFDGTLRHFVFLNIVLHNRNILRAFTVLRHFYKHISLYQHNRSQQYENKKLAFFPTIAIFLFKIYSINC